MILGSGRGGSTKVQEGTVIHAALLISSSETRTELPSSLSSARSPTISSNHPDYLLTTSLLTPSGSYHRQRRQHYLDEPQPVFALSLSSRLCLTTTLFIVTVWVRGPIGMAGKVTNTTQAELGRRCWKLEKPFEWDEVVGWLVVLRRVRLGKEAEIWAGLAVVERVWYQEE